MKTCFRISKNSNELINYFHLQHYFTGTFNKLVIKVHNCCLILTPKILRKTVTSIPYRIFPIPVAGIGAAHNTIGT